MKTLYPNIQSYAQYQVPVSTIHSLYVEESGNPNGIPVLFIHGGPGSGCSAESRRFFDPELYRIVVFDQRGCGRSTPHASLEENNSQALASDIEVIRQHLGINAWLLFGGSWGSTLALLYAQAYPERVTGLILRGIFLSRQQDFDWLYQPDGGAAQVFPDYYQEFAAPLGHELAIENRLGQYYSLLTSNNELERLAAAKAWCIWEGRISTLHAKEDVSDIYGEPHLALSMARISAHYFVNNSFIKQPILSQMEKIAHLPAMVIHGRYDMVCKLENATSLVEYWPSAQLQIVPNAGHSAMETGMIDALCKATSAMAKIIYDRSHSTS
ncbi:prolyl aminopeptidase [Motilimonas sp. E26]|uniref:prolyl aminopeptidase n=1 Tax=Motilimonas TaxID=1914248 RepID=UPI001E59C390|nr:prolyl aminopeptidase [Motilimonas sp. E26]MCE0558948.1 prolyl aminopeptidase [Motilimonas sp. E26]